MIDNRELLKAIYNGLLGRDPDDDGIGSYGGRLEQGELTPAAVMDAIAASDEHRRRRARVAAQTALQAFRSPEVQMRSDQLASLPGLDSATFKAAVNKAKSRMSAAARSYFDDDGSKGYQAEHHLRFVEMANGLSWLARRLKLESPRVLDIGGGISTVLMSACLPSARYSVLNLFANHRLEGVADNQIVMDLARTDLREPKTIQQEHHGKFDLVFCCEVLEHLLVNPVNLLRFLLQFLKPSGFLYLTTPNFLSDINLEKLSLWENPQPVYPQGYSPDEAFHHHVREYAMPELLRFVIEAGGVVDSFAFSGCWQPPEEVARSWPEQLRNMITVIRRP